MTERRSWILWGPNSGGVYQIEFDGQRIYHHYGGDAAPPEPEPPEMVTDYLVRHSASNGGDMDAVLAEIRASLDGWYWLGGHARLRFARGIPLEIAGDAYCGDVGRGGHRCEASCAGEIDYAESLPKACAVAGRSLSAGPWMWRDHPSDPYVAEVYAMLAVGDP